MQSLCDKIVVPTPFEIGPVNCYLLKTEPLTLIDTGPLTKDALGILTAELAQRGMTMSDIKRIIITHGHADHFGLAQTIVDASGAEVFIHQKESRKLTDDYHFLLERWDHLIKNGVSREFLEDAYANRFNDGPFMTPVTAFTPAQEGDRLKFADLELQVLHTPGHSAGHITLYEPNKKVLFSGDHFLRDITPNPVLEPDPGEPRGRAPSLKQFLNSVQRFHKVDVNHVYPAHGEPILDLHSHIDHLVEHHRKRTHRVQNLVTGRTLTCYQIAQELYSHLKDFDITLAVYEVIAHLDLLHDEGRVTVEWKDGCAYYHADRATA
ncbi:MAG: MBL fold metallo-hydrolase [Bacillota bacterium]